MSEHIDHAAEAVRLHDMAHDYELKNATSPTTKRAQIVIGAVSNGYAAAQVHATLALVEQQRIANLIAMFNLSEDDASDAADLGFDYLAAAKEIREGLGLGE